MNREEEYTLIPDRCMFCRGTLHEGRKPEFTARVGDEIIVIKEGPVFVCDRCGEAYYSPEISRRIDAVMRDVHEGRICARPLAAGEVDLAV